ncbi:hypothetical protein BDD12DRAFT_838767 [Trichophaea hybrida]|nr:hypothetical protein BDD12DRAFT_838767 [Trichophaea hybrida]
MSPIYVTENPRHSSSSIRGGDVRHPSSSLCVEHDDNSLPLNTPWFTPPSSSASSAPRRRSRRSSSVHEHSPSLGPLIVQQPHHHHHHSHSPERHHTTSKTLIVPGSSRHHTHYHNRTSRYYDAVTRTTKQESGDSFPQHGRTRFPRKLVCREAVEEQKLPYTLEADGAVTVLQALEQPVINALVARTEQLKHNPRHSPRGGAKAVSFYEKTVVHEVPNGTTPHTSQHSRPVVMVPGGKTKRYESSYLADSPPKFEPLSPPGPSTPRGIKTLELGMVSGTKMEQKIAKQEAKVLRAEERFAARGREEDRIEAVMARGKLEELRRKWDTRRAVGVKVGRNQRGEVVIVKG